MDYRNLHSVPLSRNLGALTSWNPLGLSRPVMGLLYLYLIQKLAAMCDVPSTAYSLNVVGVAVSFQAVHEFVLGLLVVLSPAPYTIAS